MSDEPGGHVRRSMTGFGRADGPQGLSVEVRTVNSRHLEVRLRLPRELAGLEREARAAGARFFERGQVEIAVRLPQEGELAPRLEFDLDLARRYASAAQELVVGLGIPSEITAAKLLSFPGVARVREPELEAATMATALIETISSACKAAAEMRAREGESLLRELRGRLVKIEAFVSQVEARAAAVLAGLRERLDPARIEQEVVLYVDRQDVTEETVRLRSHLDQFSETLDAPGAIGRKLEFLLQEMGRETNTLGSKSADAVLTRVVVELKTEQEKLREQVLNIE